MDEFTPPGGLAGGIASSVFGIAMLIMWLRKKWTGDSADIAGNRAEVDIIAVLQKERDDLRQMLKESNAERNEQWKQIATLSAQLEIMQNKVSSLTDEVTRLRAALERSNDRNQ